MTVKHKETVCFPIPKALRNKVEKGNEASLDSSHALAYWHAT